MNVNSCIASCKHKTIKVSRYVGLDVHGEYIIVGSGLGISVEQAKLFGQVATAC